MDIELGIQNVARPVNFSTEESADSVGKAIAQAVANDETINLTDDKGRHIIVPAKALGYAHHRFRDQARRRSALCDDTDCSRAYSKPPRERRLCAIGITAARRVGRFRPRWPHRSGSLPTDSVCPYHASPIRL